MADVQKIVDDLSALTISEAAELAKMLEAKWSGANGDGRSLVLFEDRERTRTEPLRRGEQLFDFYDSCASPGYSEFRSVVNGWLAQMPADDRAALITRMRYGGDREFGSSLSELSIHAFIAGSGSRARPHPEVPGSTKRPDYAAIDQAEAPVAYIEVTTVNPPAAEEAEKNRENPVYNAINGAKIPAGSILGYSLVRAGKNSPPLRPLVADVERWARDNAEAAKTKRSARRLQRETGRSSSTFIQAAATLNRRLKQSVWLKCEAASSRPTRICATRCTKNRASTARSTSRT